MLHKIVFSRVFNSWAINHNLEETILVPHVGMILANFFIGIIFKEKYVCVILILKGDYRKYHILYKNVFSVIFE